MSSIVYYVIISLSEEIMPVVQVILIYVQPTCNFRELDALGLPGLLMGMAKLKLYDAHLLRQGLNIVRDTAPRGIFPIFLAKAILCFFCLRRYVSASF